MRAEKTHKLGLGVRNTTEVFDYEFFHVPQYPGRTLLGDIFNPFIEYHFDHFADIEIGAIMERAYGGNSLGRVIDPVKPWLRLTTHPFKPVRLTLGNLAYPHGFYPPIYFETVQFENRLSETGIQILYDDPDRPALPHNDFFFNYQRQDTAATPLEKFDFGDVMQGRWGHLRGDYQAHWIHQGGQLTSRAVSNTNDTVQLFGSGLDFKYGGGTLAYLLSHKSTQLGDGAYSATNGNAHFAEVYAAWWKFRISYLLWHSFLYQHEEANPIYLKPNAQAFSLRFNSSLRESMRIWLEYVGYNFEGATPGKFLPVESGLHLRASWEFHFPLLEWTSKDKPDLEAGPQFQSAPAGTGGPEFRY